MGLIDQLMASRSGIAPQVAQMQRAQQSPMPMPNQSPVGGAPMPMPAQVSPPPSMMQRLQGIAQQVQGNPMYQSTLGDEDWRARKALALNSMRLEPDANLAAGLREQLVSNRENRKQTQQANRTAEVLEKAGEKDIADAIRANPESAGALYSEYLKSRLKPQDQYETYRGTELGLTGAEAEALYRMNIRTNKLERVGGAGTTVNLPGGETKYEEVTAEGVGKLINAGLDLAPNAQELLATVSQLEALSPYVGQDLRAVPAFMRNMLPEGMSETVDAYRSQLNGLVGSLRVAGSGDQSDREMLNMLARGGSIATSPEARAIAHNALRRKGERDLALSELSARAAAGELGRQEFLQERGRILSEPLFTGDERALIERLEAVPAGGAGGQTGGQIQTRQEAVQELQRRAQQGDSEAVRAIEELRKLLSNGGQQ